MFSQLLAYPLILHSVELRLGQRHLRHLRYMCITSHQCFTLFFNYPTFSSSLQIKGRDPLRGFKGVEKKNMDPCISCAILCFKNTNKKSPATVDKAETVKALFPKGFLLHCEDSPLQLCVRACVYVCVCVCV